MLVGVLIVKGILCMSPILKVVALPMVSGRIVKHVEKVG